MSKLTAWLNGSRKAIAAGVAAGGASIAAAMTESSPGGTDIVAVEWRAAAIAAVIAWTAVYAVPNGQ